MPVTAPSVPTIPPPAPRRHDRPAGRRTARLHEVLRRSSRPGYWVRTGAPSASEDLQGRKQTGVRVLVACLILCCVVALVIANQPKPELVAFDEHRADYDELVRRLDNVRITAIRPVWRLPIQTASAETAAAFQSLGVRVVDGDQRLDAYLFRPGGRGEERALAHLGGRGGRIGTDEQTLQRTAFSRSATSWEPLGDGWYRVTGRWSR